MIEFNLMSDLGFDKKAELIKVLKYYFIVFL